MLALTATPIPRTLHMSLAGLRDISIIEILARGPAGDSNARRRVRRRAGPDGARARARAWRAVVLPAQPRRDDRGGGDEAPGAVPRPALSRRPRADEDASWEPRWSSSCAATPTWSCRPRSSSRASTSPRRTRSSSSGPTCSGSRSCTRSGDTSAARRCRRTRTSSTRTRWSSRRRRVPVCRRSPTTELGSGFSIAMRDLEIRGAGSSSARGHPRRTAALGFELYVELLNEAVAELPGRAAYHRAPHPHRRPHRRLHPCGLRRLRGAQDRPPPTAGVDGVRGRAE